LDPTIVAGAGDAACATRLNCAIAMTPSDNAMTPNIVCVNLFISLFL
jgi:hypothetical protein